MTIPEHDTPAALARDWHEAMGGSWEGPIGPGAADPRNRITSTQIAELLERGHALFDGDGQASTYFVVDQQPSTGDWYWTEKGLNHEPVATSGEGYGDRDPRTTGDGRAYTIAVAKARAAPTGAKVFDVDGNEL